MRKYLSLFKINIQYFPDSKNKKIWNLGFKLAVWYNLIYFVAALITIQVLLSFITLPVSLEGYINTILFLSIPVSTLVINFRIFVKMFKPILFILGIILNFICFLYLLIRPEYTNLFMEVFILSGPVLNILILIKIFAENRIRKNISAFGT